MQEFEEVKEALEISKIKVLEKEIEIEKATAKINNNDSFFGLDEWREQVNPDEHMEF